MELKFIVLSVVLVFLWVTEASAEKTQWSMVAGACVPNDNTVKEGLIHRDAGGAFFAHDKIGEAVLFCPVESAGGAIKKVDWLKLTLNRTLAGGAVRAELFRMKESSGQQNQVGPSTPTPADLKGLHTLKQSASHTFEEGYFYYVRIRIAKHGINNRISVKGVSLGVN